MLYRAINRLRASSTRAPTFAFSLGNVIKHGEKFLNIARPRSIDAAAVRVAIPHITHVCIIKTQVTDTKCSFFKTDNDTEMSGSTVTWNNELIFQLIDLYKERKFLWDTSMVEYKDRIKKNEAWCEIAKCLGMDKEAVERKIKILLTQFRREVIKLGDDSRWFAYNKLLFMKPRVERLLHLQQNSGQSVSVSDYEVFIVSLQVF